MVEIKIERLKNTEIDKYHFPGITCHLAKLYNFTTRLERFDKKKYLTEEVIRGLLQKSGFDSISISYNDCSKIFRVMLDDFNLEIKEK